MKKLLCLLVGLILFWAGVAMAATKIGVVDMQKVISQSEPGQQALAKLKKKTKGMKADLDKQKKELQALREELQKQALVLSQEAKQDKELEFRKKVRDYQDTWQAYQRKIKLEEQKLSRPIIQLLAEVIKNYAKKNGYTAIWDMRASGLLYANEKVNITNEIMAELNKAWKKKYGKGKK
ncbi:periplasmic chaperone for outer membrane proteins Skp [Desulfonauticus submarinus]|uniref:Periplasmic chaperone for outer membrane proteins Skp n=1 Tax=Desulfonauticus submarinus TaxID=206665 RepID=A0A1H0DA61_9BACT|nr:OmpH family outer membrane protein [Desulfonauticus submarinus]SDN67104.1 periplasmic chaperone for outer membrane proteins Skp [Desulfonauticus submarinus]